MSYGRTIIIVVILAVTAGVTLFISQSKQIALTKSFDLFPAEIGSWKGVRSTLDPEVFNILGVEDYILANYRTVNGGMVNLYVGFYQSQKEGDLIHSPKNCLPGAGWNIVKTSEETIDFNGTPRKISRLLLQKGGERQIVLYWFQSRGRIIASEYMQKIWLVFDSITRHRTDGAFVRLISPIVDGEQTTADLLKEFAKQVKPVLDDYIPS